MLIQRETEKSKKKQSILHKMTLRNNYNIYFYVLLIFLLCKYMYTSFYIGEISFFCTWNLCTFKNLHIIHMFSGVCKDFLWTFNEYPLLLDEEVFKD